MTQPLPRWTANIVTSDLNTNFWRRLFSACRQQNANLLISIHSFRHIKTSILDWEMERVENEWTTLLSNLPARVPSFAPQNCQCQSSFRHLERQNMNRKGVLEPRGPRTDNQETTPLLTAYSHTEITGGSAVDGAALRRNGQDGKNTCSRNFTACSE